MMILRIFLFILLLITSNSAFSDTYRMYWEPAANVGNIRAGIANSIEAIYDDESHRLLWRVNFSLGTENCLPNGFNLAINGTGENPKGHDGEMAIFYYDVSNPTQPILNVFAYNGILGVAGTRSFMDGSNQPGNQAPDPILSSITNPELILNFFNQSNSDGTITIGFEVDSTMIQNHMPVYPDPDPIANPWQGAQFNNILGMWFHPRCGLETTYNANGFLTSYTYDETGWYDTVNTPARKENPGCETMFPSPIELLIGDTLDLNFVIEDPQNDDVTVNYMGLPNNMMVMPSAGSIVTNGTTGNLEWTPTVSDVGSYDIKVLLEDIHGAPGICALEVNVPANIAPVCNISSVHTGLACDTETQTTQLVLKTFDPDANPIAQAPFVEWTTDCPNAFFSNTKALSPELTFNSEAFDGTPTNCTATVTVTDTIDTVSCSTSINVAQCVRDCAGTINGSLRFDECNVCNGDSTTCADCTGVPNGSTNIDDCGVCDGDNTSCLNCTAASISSNIAELDNAALNISTIAKRVRREIIRRVERLSSSQQELYVDAVKSYMEAWGAINNVPLEVQSCENQVLCSSTSHASAVSTYTESVSVLNRNVKRLIRSYRNTLKVSLGFSNAKAKRRVRRFNKSRRRLVKTIDANVSLLPISSDSCS